MENDQLIVGAKSGHVHVIDNQGIIQQSVEPCIKRKSSKSSLTKLPSQTSTSKSTKPTLKPLSQTGIDLLIVTTRGFIAAASKMGKIYIYENSEEGLMFSLIKTLTAPENTDSVTGIHSMAVTTTEGSLMIGLESNQFYRIPLMYSNNEDV